MNTPQLAITYIGGPTCLLEFGGVRFLTDPTFDPAGGDYTTGPVTLHKLTGPGLTPEALGSFDYVLLTHDHHADNLDNSAAKYWPMPKQFSPPPKAQPGSAATAMD